MERPLFCLEKASFGYGSALAISSLDLRVDRGEKIAIIGPSGAGKTSLLRLLKESTTEPYAFVAQHYGLVSELSLFHNVYMGQLDQRPLWENLRNLVFPSPKLREQIEPLLVRLGLGGMGQKVTGKLSGGQQQRAALARALFRQADLLLADEPVSALDPQQGPDLLRLLFCSCETVVLAIHSVELALDQADRILGMKAGCLLFDRPASGVTEGDLSNLFEPC